MAAILLGIGLMVFLAHFFAALFARTRVPDVLLLMLVGIALGPVGHLLTPADFGKVGAVLSNLAFVIILFESGLTLDIGVLQSAVGTTLRLSLSTAALTFASATVAGLASGLPLLQSTLLGSILAATATSVVIPMVKSLRVGGTVGTVLVLEAALTDVLCIVATNSLIGVATMGKLEPLRMVGNILSALVFAAVLGVLAGAVWLALLGRVRRFDNSMFTTVAWALMVFGVADELGFSGAVAVVALGATLTNKERFRITELPGLRGRQIAELDDADFAFFGELLFLLKTFFFLYLGLSMRMPSLQNLGWALVILLPLYIGRHALVRLFVPRTVPASHATVATVMVPKGLAAAVLASLPLQAGVAHGEALQELGYLVVMLSIFLTAVAVPLQSLGPIAALYRRLFDDFAESEDVAERQLMTAERVEGGPGEDSA